MSYDEASYDSRLGKIEYSCTDDEVIAGGAPGAAMYDQNIRETSVTTWISYAEHPFLLVFYSHRCNTHCPNTGCS